MIGKNLPNHLVAFCLPRRTLFMDGSLRKSSLRTATRGSAKDKAKACSAKKTQIQSSVIIVVELLHNVDSGLCKCILCLFSLRLAVLAWHCMSVFEQVTSHPQGMQHRISFQSYQTGFNSHSLNSHICNQPTIVPSSFSS